MVADSGTAKSTTCPAADVARMTLCFFTEIKTRTRERRLGDDDTKAYQFHFFLRRLWMPVMGEFPFLELMKRLRATLASLDICLRLFDRLAWCELK